MVPKGLDVVGRHSLVKVDPTQTTGIDVLIHFQTNNIKTQFPLLAWAMGEIVK